MADSIFADLRGVKWLPDLLAVLCERLEWLFPQMYDQGLPDETIPETNRKVVLQAKGEIPDVIWKALLGEKGWEAKLETPQAEIDPLDAWTTLRLIDDVYRQGALWNALWDQRDVSEELAPLIAELDRSAGKAGHSLTTDPLRFGCLFPCKGGRPTRGQYLANHLANFRWVRPTPGFGIRYRRLAKDEDVCGPDADSVRVGFLPSIDGQDVRFVPSNDGDGQKTFRIEWSKDAEARVAQRICDAIAQLRADIDLLILPELAGSEEIWKRVADFMIRESNLMPRLRLVLLGTASIAQGGSKARNRACLINSHGQVVMTQDKIHLYAMSRSEIETYHLQEVLDPALGDFQEDASIHPRVLQLCESKGLGRFAVLICEDFCHLEPAVVTAIKLGAQFLICPVMDGNFEPFRWVAGWADWYWRAYGVQSIAINSLVLPGRQAAARKEYEIGVVAKRPAPLHGVHILSCGDPSVPICSDVRLRRLS